MLYFRQSPYKYRGFISYSLKPDDSLAAAVHQGLRDLAKPWYAIQALRIFRDKIGLPATADLRNAIFQKLEQSEWLLLMASPQSAQSSWVPQEVQWWLDHQPVDKLLILLSDGDLVWDRERNDFDWSQTNALPRLLSGKFQGVPRYVDLRPFRNGSPPSLRQAAFRAAIADIAAPLHGKDRDVFDDLVRSRRRQRRWAFGSGIALVTGLSFLAFWQYMRGARSEIESLVDDAANQWRQKSLEALISATDASLRVEAMNRSLDAWYWRLFDAHGWNQTEARSAARLLEILSEIREKNRLSGHSDTVNAIASRPRCSQAVSGADDWTTRIWRADGTPGEILKHKAEVTAVALGPDCRTIASASRDGAINLWTTKAIPLQNIQAGAEVKAIAFSPDGQVIAAGDEQGRIGFWNLSGAELKKRWQAHQAAVTALGFGEACPGQTPILASASMALGEPVKRWHEDGSFLPIPGTADQANGHRGPVSSLSISPDCTRIATGGQDHTIKLWRSDGRFLKTLEGHAGPVRSVAFSSDGQSLVSAGETDWQRPGPDAQAGNMVKLWQAGREIANFAGHTGPVTGVGFGFDGRTIVSGGDTSVRLWSSVPAPVTKVLDSRGTARNAAFSPDGRTVAIVHDARVVLLDLAGPRLPAYPIDPDAFRDVVFDPRGTAYVLDAGLPRAVDGGQDIPLSGQPAPIRAFNFSPDGSLIVAVDDSLRVHDRAGAVLASNPGYASSAKTLAVSPDGGTVASLLSEAEANTIRLWRWRRNQTVVLPPQKERINSLRYAPDGATLVSAGADGTVRLWGADGTPRNPLTGHSAEVTDAVFHPRGKILASVDSDGNIKLWSVQGTELLPLKPDTQNIWAIGFMGDGRYLAAAGQNGKLMLWDLDPGDLVREACLWLKDFLATSPDLSEADKSVCRRD